MPQFRLPVLPPSRPSARRPTGPSVLFALLVLLAPPLAAQVGLGTDIIVGRVTSTAGVAVANVDIAAYSLETQVTRRARTNQNGQFTILFTDGGGQYRLTARAIGFVPVQQMVMRQADEDRLVWNVELEPGAVTMAPITVQARRQPPPGAQAERPTPGSTERALNPDLVARLPIDAADLNLLATLVPGVVGLEATDSSTAAFSVAGLRPDANALTLDGLTFGSAAIPQDALRTTRVVTGTYDVARGQFSGGLVAATTRAGSNVVQGTSQYILRDDDLAVSGDEATPYTQGFTQHQLSAGLGGPIIRDRLFVFGSGQVRLRADPQQTLLTAGPDDLFRLGVHPDSVERFTTIVDSLGVPSTAPPDGGRSSSNFSGLLRLDAVLSDAHTLALRGDYRGTGTDPSRLGPLALPETGGTFTTSGGGGMLTLSSRFGTRVINDLRAYVQRDVRTGTPFLAVPQGRVQVASELADSTTGITTLVFGGNAGLPTSAQATRFEAADEVAWLAGRGHRFRLGGLLASQWQADVAGGNRYGTFNYNSLAELETDRSGSFRRSIAVAERTSQALDGALFAGDVWSPSPTLQLTYGLRLEGSGFSGAPAYNPAVDSAFGRRTDELPSDWRLSPRAGFTVSLGGGRERGRLTSPPTWVLRGGAGQFRSPVPATLVAQVYGATGLDASGATLTCTGLGVPPSDWAAYGSDPGSIPIECAAPGPLPETQPVRTVALFAEDFAAPRSWRASLGAQRTLTALLRFTVDASYTRGVSQSGVRDLNLDTVPEFALAAEGGRPVYVPVRDIAPLTGAVRFSGSRINREFGSVIEQHADLASEAWQVTTGLGGIVGRGIMVQASYTWQHASDQGSTARFGGANTTAGNPNIPEWARSDFERRHQVLATLTYPFGSALEVTTIGRFTSGAPYTPIVESDINGDGARNDRAFVFDPASGAAASAGIGRLLAEGSGGVSDCLQPQVGAVAARNSCTGPWQASLDFQVNWRPAFFGLNRRLSISVVTVNFLRGVDELLHGADGAKGWGLAARPDPTLLYVTGFDPMLREYAYQVNERFGATGGSATASRPPFQIGVQARLTIGPDRTRGALDALRGQGRGGPGGAPGQGGAGGGLRGALAGGDLAARLDSLIPNPAALVLQRGDNLDLTADQVTRLEALRDSLAARNLARAETVRKAVENEGANPDPARLLGVVRPVIEEGRRDLEATHTAVRAVLTDVQWAKLPERLRSLPQTMRRPPG